MVYIPRLSLVMKPNLDVATRKPSREILVIRAYWLQSVLLVIFPCLYPICPMTALSIDDIVDVGVDTVAEKSKSDCYKSEINERRLV